ncbi:MAG: XdhC family protein [bacterium]
MQKQLLTTNYTHPLDILGFMVDGQRRGQAVALIKVTNVIGGGIRRKGAIMAVTEKGASAGSVSNGCVDADIIRQAQQALREGSPRCIRYGQGSPFLDIRLPCGGGLELVIVPDIPADLVSRAFSQLGARQATSLNYIPQGGDLAPEKGTAPPNAHDALLTELSLSFIPKIKIRVIGRGIEPVALARMALAADMEIAFYSPDQHAVTQAECLGINATYYSDINKTAPMDDQWTAVVLMFHDHDQEPALLVEALKGPAFFIGALGSQATHLARCNALRDRGVHETEIARVSGPIGLIPGTRDASMLAISTLAEIAHKAQSLFS